MIVRAGIKEDAVIRVVVGGWVDYLIIVRAGIKVNANRVGVKS